MRIIINVFLRLKIKCILHSQVLLITFTNNELLSDRNYYNNSLYILYLILVHDAEEIDAKKKFESVQTPKSENQIWRTFEGVTFDPPL